MCNNVSIRLLLALLVIVSGDAFRLFSSDTGTYKEARAFFTSPKSLVRDYFDGNLASLSSTINSHTFVFAMYYANFCGISRRMRAPFEKAAAFYREQIHHGNTTVDKFHVKFVAIDCFYHDGQCRKTYKLNYYPHLLLYVKGSRGYQYYGPAIASNLIEFIEKIRMPVIRLTNTDEFVDLTIRHETSILAHFDLTSDVQRQQYSLFAQAALKHIEYENEHPIRFAAILNRSIVDELSQHYNEPFPVPFVILHRLNSVPHAFPNLTNNFTLENLFQWVVSEHRKPFVGWIVPRNHYYSRSPSNDLASMVDAMGDHDNLLLFLTSSPSDELKLRQIYFHLSNCHANQSSLWLTRIEHFYHRLSIDRKLNLSKSQRHLLSSCCQHIFSQLSTTDIYQLCLFNQSLPLLRLPDKQCSPIFDSSPLQQRCARDYCSAWLKNLTTIYRTKLDYSHEIMLGRRREKFYGASGHSQPLTMNDSDAVRMNAFAGLLCRVNSTWAFRLINTRDYPNFGSSLGVNQSRAVVVLQAKNEQQYTLDPADTTTEKIYQLIDDVSHNSRSRSLVSIPLVPVTSEHSNRLIELTTDTFQSIVFDPTKHVLVVYYTKWCGFCQSIWPALFQTKKFFDHFDDIRFTRIQADKHDLPWHLTVYAYPTILLFPAGRKSGSLVFPSSTDSITSVNLIKFLLYHLYVDHQYHRADQHKCLQSNNSFVSMLSSSYVDFSQLSYLVKSFS